MATHHTPITERQISTNSSDKTLQFDHQNLHHEMSGEALGLEITELRLGLPGVEKKELVMKKRLFAEVGPAAAAEDQNSTSEEGAAEGGGRGKTRVVGWPPVCSYRQRSCNYGGGGVEEKKSGASMDVKKIYVKVSMDGAPFLRKVDLNAFAGGYSALSVGVKELFGSLGVVNLNGINDSENSEYVTIYEDKEGDWMLVGDVPWKMFTESCKRLRIMKASDAKGFNLQVRNPEAHFQGITKKETKGDDH